MPCISQASAPSLCFQKASVLVLGATNLPWELDPAFRRRFEQRIFIGLPDAAARRQLLHAFTASVDPPFSGADMQTLAELTQRFSASDIKGLVRVAMMGPMRELSASTHFCRGPQHAGMQVGPWQLKSRTATVLGWGTTSLQAISVLPHALCGLNLFVQTSCKAAKKPQKIMFAIVFFWQM